MYNWLLTLPPKLWFRAGLFSILYVLAAWVSREVSFPLASFPTVWFPSGLFVAVLLLSDPKSWPAYLLAALPVNLAFDLIYGDPLLNSLLFGISNLLEAITGAWLVRRLQAGSGSFNTPIAIIRLIVISAIMGSALSATISTTLLGTLQDGIDYWSTWRIAWISHGLGILAFAPLVLSWADIRTNSFLRANPERLLEWSILTTGLLVCALYVFIGDFGLFRHSYLIVPFLVWAALRFGLRGAAFHGFIVTVMSSLGTANQLQSVAYSDATIAFNMDSLGSFQGITLITCYILATTWEQSRQIELALRDNEARYRLLVENQGEGIGIVDAEEIFTFANPAAAQVFGVPTGELVGRSLKEFTTSPNFASLRQQTEQRKKGEKTTYEIEIIQPAGNRRSLLVTATSQFGPNGGFSGTFAIIHDITERKQVELALRDSRSRFQTLFDHSPIPIWEEDFSRIKRLIDGIYKENCLEETAEIEFNWREYFFKHPEQVEACETLVRVLDVNQATIELFGFRSKAEFMAQVHKMLRRGPRDIFIEEMVAIARGNTEFEMEGPNDVMDGVIRYHYVRWTVAPGYEKDYRRVIVTIIDVTERRAAEERMRYLSTHDVLTGIYNRNFFEAELERLQNSRLEPVNVMMVDVNGMKVANDTLGHSAGDELLRRTAQVLKQSFRKEDVIARIGGDEFVILFYGSIPMQEAVDRVKDCLKEHNHWYEGQTLSLAIGAVSGGKGSSLVDLLKKADQIMYREKLRSRKNSEDSKPEGKTGNFPQPG